ncbi:hypothetical protein J6590_025971 [Homalodisca vitripennis]|nr:hypothetical protein J6590_025971 [Homalodisca vitripennis]
MWTNRTTPRLGTINALRQCDSRGNSLITTPLTPENAALATRVATEPLRQDVDRPNNSAAGDDQCIASNPYDKMWTDRTSLLLGTINELRQCCDSRGNSLITTPLTAENAALATRVDTEPLRQDVDQPNDSAAGDDQCIASVR